jgi:hypothetical protein
MNLLGEANPNLKDQMLNLMGVTVVESIDLSEPYGVRFDSRQAFTRIRWVGCGIQVDDSQAALEMIRAGSIDHKAQVLLETEVFEKPPICSDQLQAELQVQEESSNVISTKVHSQAAGYLVVADVWYPGWQAYVDGERAPLLRANYLFKAIPIPAGEHEVAVLYQPKAFNLGAAVSIAAIILLIGLVAIRIRDRSSTS